MKNYRVANWDKVNPYDPTQKEQLTEAINFFLRTPAAEMRKLAVTHFTQRGDFPADGYPYLEQLRKVVPADMGWSSVFRVLDFTTGDGAGGESGFDIAAAGTGVVLEEIRPGERAKVYQAVGKSLRVPFLLYSGAIQNLRTLVQDGRWWDVDDSLNELRNAYYTLLAGTHYGLLESVAATWDVAWQAATPSALSSGDYNYVLSRDANTINAACLQVVGNADNWGGVSPSSTFVIVAPLALAQRLRRAIGTDQYGTRLVGFNVALVVTQNLSASDKFYVAPEGVAGRSGTRLDYEIEFEADALANADTIVARSRFGAAILNENVIARCATADPST